MLTKERALSLRYGVALGSVVLATLIRFLLIPVLGDSVPFIFYFPAVVASAWYGGLGPGLFSTCLSALLAWWLFVSSSYSATLGAWSPLARLFAFLLGCIFISLLADRTRRAYRKATESERREREEQERLRVTLASIADAVIATDVQGRVTLLNGVAETLTGWKREEALGKPLDEIFCIINENTRQKVDSPIKKVIREGATVGLANHTVLSSRDGTERPIADSGAPIRGNSGEIVGAVLVFRDVTAERRQEQALRESEAYFRSLADAMPQLVWTARPDGTVEYYNSRYCEYSGIAPKADNTWDGQPIIHEEDRQATLNAWQAAMQSRSSYECEHRIQLADGSFRWHLSRAHPMKDQTGTVIKWFGTATDIHDLREGQQVLRENDRRKDEFLAMLAHELRNPLAPIQNAITVLRHLGSSTPQVKQMHEMIERQTEHLTRLVDDLLDVSRITRGKITLQRERLDLRSVISRAVETSRPVIESGRHRLNILLPSESLYIKGDLTRLAQVVANLLGNAAKYTEEGGQIELSVKRQGNEALIQVKDNGVGIPADILPHIFDLFAQADRSLDRAQGGLGIGLTIVRSIVQLHGGRVEAYSEGSGKGSEFIIRLPAFTEPSREIEPHLAEKEPEKVPADPPLCKILVVDDNVDSAASMALLLEFEGHEVRQTHDGPETLRVAQDFHPQVVLLDIGLPGMNGYEVAQALRQDSQFENLLLVAITGYGQEEDRRRSREAGFDHHLTKPVDHNVLNSILKTRSGK